MRSELQGRSRHGAATVQLADSFYIRCGVGGVGLRRRDLFLGGKPGSLRDRNPRLRLGPGPRVQNL